MAKTDDEEPPESATLRKRNFASARALSAVIWTGTHMNTRSKIVALALCAFGALAFFSLGASAQIVCNADGDCWHAHTVFAYPPSVQVVIHPGDWHWREGEHFAWKEHAGRGYWRNGRWLSF